jgi:hypothetical protein
MKNKECLILEYILLIDPDLFDDDILTEDIIRKRLNKLTDIQIRREINETVEFLNELGSWD